MLTGRCATAVALVLLLSVPGASSLSWAAGSAGGRAQGRGDAATARLRMMGARRALPHRLANALGSSRPASPKLAPKAPKPASKAAAAPGRSARTGRPGRAIEGERPAKLGERTADRLAGFAGSWTFIGASVAGMLGWMGINAYMANPFDPAPFIGLNLVLSTIAALQAPFILMSQNRQSARDRAQIDKDLAATERTGAEVAALHKKIDALTQTIDSMARAQASPPR